MINGKGKTIPRFYDTNADARYEILIRPPPLYQTKSSGCPRFRNKLASRLFHINLKPVKKCLVALLRIRKDFAIRRDFYVCFIGAVIGKITHPIGDSVKLLSSASSFKLGVKVATT